MKKKDEKRESPPPEDAQKDPSRTLKWREVKSSTFDQITAEATRKVSGQIKAA